MMNYHKASAVNYNNNDGLLDNSVPMLKSVISLIASFSSSETERLD